MERYAWKGHVKPGRMAEYKKRHDEIWEEMKEMFRRAGIRNYSIWNVGDDLFGYYECESIEEAGAVQAQSEVTYRWKEYMKDIMEMEKDPVTGAQPQLQQIFLFEK